MAFKKGHKFGKRFVKGYIPWNKDLKQEAVCKGCGKIFYHHKTKDAKRHRIFCSRECFIENAKLTKPKTTFKKGMIPWNKEKKGVMPIPWNKGKIGVMPTAWNKGLVGYNKGHIVTLDTRKKISKNRIRKGGCFGNKNPNWNNGSSFEPYGIEFNNQLKNYIRWMDNYTCQQCGICQDQLNYKLCIHHIDFNKKNNTIQNLISLCRTCHLQTNYNREDWTIYFQNKIGGVI